MREQIERRLAELQAEYESGQNLLTNLNQQRTNLQQTVLRISGAMQVLDELLRASDADEASVEGVDNGGNN